MRRVLASVAIGVMLIGATTPVLATSPITATVTRASLAARIQVTINFDVVCQPITDFLNTNVVDATMGARITVDQASGRSIAHAEAGDTMPSGTPNIVCDGVTVNHESLSAISSTVPFHGGSAVVGLSVNVDDPGCIFCGGNEFTSVQTIVNLR
jgi:hypothetical protein